MVLVHVIVIQVCNFLVGLFFLDLVEKFGVAPVYGTFGGVSLLAAIFSTYFIVETKGRSLEEIEMSLSSDFIARDKKWPYIDTATIHIIDQIQVSTVEVHKFNASFHFFVSTINILSNVTSLLSRKLPSKEEYHLLVVKSDINGGVKTNFGSTSPIMLSWIWGCYTVVSTSAGWAHIFPSKSNWRKYIITL